MSAAADAHVAQHGGALSERDAKVACRRIARALARLHAAGFAHRDVKLENLLLARPNDLSSLKLADFGFATVVSDDKGRRPRCALFERKDATGDRLQGTVEYAAPEILVDLARAAEAEKKEASGEGRRERKKTDATEENARPRTGTIFFHPRLIPTAAPPRPARASACGLRRFGARGRRRTCGRSA